MPRHVITSQQLMSFRRQDIKKKRLVPKKDVRLAGVSHAHVVDSCRPQKSTKTRGSRKTTSRKKSKRSSELLISDLQCSDPIKAAVSLAKARWLSARSLSSKRMVLESKVAILRTLHSQAEERAKLMVNMATMNVNRLAAAAQPVYEGRPLLLPKGGLHMQVHPVTHRTTEIDTPGSDQSNPICLS